LKINKEGDVQRDEEKIEKKKGGGGQAHRQARPITFIGERVLDRKGKKTTISKSIERRGSRHVRDGGNGGEKRVRGGEGTRQSLGKDSKKRPCTSWEGKSKGTEWWQGQIGAGRAGERFLVPTRF